MRWLEGGEDDLSGRGAPKGLLKIASMCCPKERESNNFQFGLTEVRD